MSKMIYRLIEPDSQILLFWGEAADIHDLHKTTDIWGIATRANIPWLTDFHLSNKTIDEEKVEEAIKDGIKKYNIIKTFVT